MPIASFVDYLPVMDEFIAHWNFYGGTIGLPENGLLVGIDSFLDLRDELDVTKSSLQVKLNDLENSRVVLEDARTTAGDRVAEFNRRIRADFPNNQLFNRLPAAPNRTAGRDVMITAMDDVLDLWTRVNAQPVSPIFTGPLLLMGGLTRAQFLALRAQVDVAFTSRGTAELGTAAVRLDRDTLQARALDLMKKYRLKVEALFPEDSAEVLTLPRLTPAPGHTPDPVDLTGIWDIADARAELSWTESTDADLDRYELRATPGLEYSAEDETTVATFAPGSPLVYQTTTGFGLPGNAVSYKLYVRLTTGNEAGSEAVTVTRPV